MPPRYFCNRHQPVRTSRARQRRLEAKVRAYVPVVSLAKICDVRISDAASGEHRAMLEAVKSDPNANKLAYRALRNADGLHQGDGGQRVAFCKDFIAANSRYAKARFTAVVEDHMSDVSTSVQEAIAHNVCGTPPVRLSKADWKPYALIKKMLRNEQNLVRENAETNGWNVTEETTAVTEQFCAAVKLRRTSPPSCWKIRKAGKGAVRSRRTPHSPLHLWLSGVRGYGSTE